MLLLAQIVHRIIQLFILVIVIQAILSYFMSPYEPIRRTIDRIVNPFLNPIRRILPPMAGLDFSPFVLIILLYIVDAILMRLFVSLSG
jgi:YggT family protein